MNFIGVGYGEILLILVAALIIFGPQRLPEVAGQAARWIRDARKMMTDLSSEFERNAGMKEFKQAIEGEIKGVKQELEGAGLSVKNDLSAAAGTANSAFGSAAKSAQGAKKTGAAASPAAAKSTKPATAATSTRSSKPKPTKADPLAGLVQMTEVTPSRSKAGATASPNGNGHGSAAQETAAGAVRETSEAIVRLRERRSGAGYNRRVPTS
jgi:Tat protein translocase TatB subunit